MPGVDDAFTFLAVAQEGSFLAAGERLGLATSTVTRRVQALEERLGTLLVERTTRGSELTAAGRLYAERVAVAHARLQDAEDALRTSLTEPAGRLRVAAPGGLLRTTLTPVVLDFARRFPDVDLEVFGTDDDLHPDVEGLDVVVRASRTPPPPELTQVTLGSLKMGVFAAPAWLQAQGPMDDPEALAGHRCVVLGPAPQAAHVRFWRGDQLRALTVPMALLTNSISLARKAALAGMGPVGLPVVSCQDLQADGRLLPLLPEWSLEPVPIVALYAAGRRPPFRVRAFLDALKQAFA